MKNRIVDRKYTKDHIRKKKKKKKGKKTLKEKKKRNTCKIIYICKEKAERNIRKHKMT